MINYYYEQEIINKLAALFSYGISNKYSYTAIEERIISSSLIIGLENNEYDNNISNKSLVENTYSIKLNKDIDISFESLFLSESYIRLFFKLNKSFEYLFLYWPLSNFISKYSVYHEMDFTNLLNDVRDNIKNKTLLKMLSIKRGIKYSELSSLTGISISIIHKYSLNDKYLYKASYENIYKLSKILHVKENIFISSINVYLDNTGFISKDFYKEFKDYLGLYYVSYFDKRIDKIDFKYDSKKGYFISNNNLKLIVISKEDLINVDYINSISDKNTYIVIFSPINFNFDYQSLLSIKSFDIMIINNFNIKILKKDVKKNLTTLINSSLFIKAKNSF